MARTTRDQDLRSLHLLFGIFCLLVVLNKFLFHELWKDEWQAWQLATKTENLTELFSLLPGEGHPALWFLVLRYWDILISFLLSFTAEWFRLQLVHLILVLVSVWILVYKVKAETWKKIFFLSSYYILFEYTVLARGYILIVLLLMWWILIYQKEGLSKNNLIRYGVILFLLTQTEVYGIFISIGILSIILFKEGNFRLSGSSVFLIISILSGIFLFYLQMSSEEISLPADQVQAQTLFRKFADPFHSLTLNTFLPGLIETVFNEEPGLFALALGIVVLLMILTLFRKEKVLLISFLLVLLLFYVFSAFFFLGGVRNWGLLYVFFLVLILVKKIKVDDWKEYVVLGLTFLFGFIHGFNVMLSDATGLFSNSKEAGRFIASEIPPEVPVIGLNKAYCVALTGYAERALIGLPEKEPFWYFTSRDWRGKTYVPDMKELLMMKETLRSRKVVVVYNKPLELSFYPLLKPLGAFDRPSLRKESYFFYYF